MMHQVMKKMMNLEEIFWIFPREKKSKNKRTAFIVIGSLVYRAYLTAVVFHFFIRTNIQLLEKLVQHRK